MARNKQEAAEEIRILEAKSSIKRLHKKRKRKRPPRWHGFLDGRYVIVPHFYHPRAKCGFIYEHILIAEEKIGRPMRFISHNHPENEVVHHINMDKRDNRPDNLQILTRREHNLLHRSLGRYQKTDVTNQFLPQ